MLDRNKAMKVLLKKFTGITPVIKDGNDITLSIPFTEPDGKHIYINIYINAKNNKMSDRGRLYTELINAYNYRAMLKGGALLGNTDPFNHIYTVFESKEDWKDNGNLHVEDMCNSAKNYFRAAIALAIAVCLAYHFPYQHRHQFRGPYNKPTRLSHGKKGKAAGFLTGKAPKHGKTASVDMNMSDVNADLNDVDADNDEDSSAVAGSRKRHQHLNMKSNSASSIHEVNDKITAAKESESFAKSLKPNKHKQPNDNLMGW